MLNLFRLRRYVPTSSISIPVKNARNGLSLNSGYIELGGTLYKDTTVDNGGFNIKFGGVGGYAIGNNASVTSQVNVITSPIAIGYLSSCSGSASLSLGFLTNTIVDNATTLGVGRVRTDTTNCVTIGLTQNSGNFYNNGPTGSIWIGVADTGKNTPDIVVRKGAVGIGNITSPSALLHIQGGGTAPGSGQVKFIAGSIVTTPEDGLWEYNGTEFFVTIGAIRYSIVANLDPTAPASDGKDYYENINNGTKSWVAVVNINGTPVGVKTQLQAGAAGDWTNGSYVGATSGAITGTKGGERFTGQDATNLNYYRYEAITDNNWTRTQLA